MALAATAALGVTGAAYALTGGVINSTTAALENTALTATAAAQLNNSLGFHLGTPTVTLEGDVAPVNNNAVASVAGFLATALPPVAPLYSVINEDTDGAFTNVDMNGATIGIGTADFGAVANVAGGITVQPTQTLVIAPALTKKIAAPAVGFGYLRILGGGTVMLHGANANQPTTGVYNDYAGGTYLHEGTLVVDQDDSFGLGDVKLRGGSVFEVRSDVRLGNELFPGVVRANQDLFVRPDTTEENEVERGTQLFYRTNENAEVSVPNAGHTFTVHTGIAQDATDVQFDPSVAANDDLFATRVGMTKTGAGTLAMSDNGASITYTGGTDVAEGNVTLLSSGGLRHRSALGFAYTAAPDNAVGVWNNVNVADYATATHQTFDNALNIASGAGVTVNRDQIFGNLTGAGTFTTRSYTSGTATVFPTVILRTDRQDGATFTRNLRDEGSYFTGTLSGPMDIIVDTFDADMKAVVLANPNNAIPRGQTLISNGLLAIASEKTIGPDTIYLGTRATLEATNNEYRLANAHTRTDRPAFMGIGSVSIPNSQLVNVDSTAAFPTLAAVRGAELSVASLDITNDNLVINAAAAGTHVLRSGTVEPLQDYATGQVTFAGDYVLQGLDYHNIFVDRGTLRINAHPITSAADAGLMDVRVAGGSTLFMAGTTKATRDFSDVMDFRVENDSRIRVKLVSSDIHATQMAALSGDAVFEANIADYTALGAEKDHRIVIQLDLSGVAHTLKAGSWIKVITTRDAEMWSNLHYLREGSTGAAEDYIKVDVATTNNESIILRDKIEAKLSQNDYSIYLKVNETITDGDDNDDDDDKETTGSSSSGCSTGAFASFAGLLLAPLAFLRKKKD